MASWKAQPLLDARQIARRFGARWVLRGASITVASGEVVGLLGANGSGKSTLLRIFATLLKPSAGTALVYGHDLSGGADQVRAQVGFLAHSPGLYDDLSARENLVFAAAMLGLDASGVDAVPKKSCRTLYSARRSRFQTIRRRSIPKALP